MLIQETNIIILVTVPIDCGDNMWLLRKSTQPLQSFVFTQECPLLKGKEQTWIANLILN